MTRRGGHTRGPTAASTPDVWKRLVEDVVQFGVDQKAAAAIACRVIEAVRVDLRAYVTTSEPMFSDAAIVGRGFCARLEFACDRIGTYRQHNRRATTRIKRAVAAAAELVATESQ